MLLSLVYFLVRRLLGAGSRLQDEKDIELLMLRHQVKVFQRQVKRPRLRRLDRLLLAAASRAMPRGLWSSFVVRPETLLRWHRELVRKKWTYNSWGEVDMQEERAPADQRSSPRSGTSSSDSVERTCGVQLSGSAPLTCRVRDSSVVGGLADGDAAEWTIAEVPQGLWGATIRSPP